MSKVFAFHYMFSGCDKLTNLDGLENWNTSGEPSFSMMFYGSAIESTEPIKNWNTSNAMSMSAMFSYCNNLTNIELLWDTSNVTNMSSMFSDMKNLEEVDISSFDTSKVTNFANMFNGSTKLNHIYVGDKWDTSANTGATNNYFPATSNLPNFSNTNPSYRDLSYAHTGEGGYLTLKTN